MSSHLSGLLAVRGGPFPLLVFCSRRTDQLFSTPRLKAIGRPERHCIRAPETL
jgi:hypothetical protein